MSIYRIYNKDKSYIGKTKSKYVSSRIGKHRFLYNHNCKYQCASKLIFDEGEWEWEVLEKGLNDEELKIREQYYINNYPNLVNRQIPIITEDDKNNRKDRNKVLCKIYYEKNKGTEKAITTRLNNREYKAMWKLKKKWGDEWIHHTQKYNPDEYIEVPKVDRDEVIICECGGECTKRHIARHRKSQSHIKFMEENYLF